MKRLVILAMLGAVACASWRRTSEQATPLDQAQAACKAFAAKDSTEGLAARMAHAAFTECMRGHGWVRP